MGLIVGPDFTGPQDEGPELPLWIGVGAKACPWIFNGNQTRLRLVNVSRRESDLLAAAGAAGLRVQGSAFPNRLMNESAETHRELGCFTPDAKLFPESEKGVGFLRLIQRAAPRTVLSRKINVPPQAPVLSFVQAKRSPRRRGWTAVRTSWAPLRQC